MNEQALQVLMSVKPEDFLFAQKTQSGEIRIGGREEVCFCVVGSSMRLSTKNRGVYPGHELSSFQCFPEQAQEIIVLAIRQTVAPEVCQLFLISVYRVKDEKSNDRSRPPQYRFDLAKEFEPQPPFSAGAFSSKNVSSAPPYFEVGVAGGEGEENLSFTSRENDLSKPCVPTDVLCQILAGHFDRRSLEDLMKSAQLDLRVRQMEQRIASQLAQKRSHLEGFLTEAEHVLGLCEMAFERHPVPQVYLEDNASGRGQLVHDVTTLRELSELIKPSNKGLSLEDLKDYSMDSLVQIMERLLEFCRHCMKSGHGIGFFTFDSITVLLEKFERYMEDSSWIPVSRSLEPDHNALELVRPPLTAMEKLDRLKEEVEGMTGLNLIAEHESERAAILDIRDAVVVRAKLAYIDLMEAEIERRERAGVTIRDLPLTDEIPAKA